MIELIIYVHSHFNYCSSIFSLLCFRRLSEQQQAEFRALKRKNRKSNIRLYSFRVSRITYSLKVKLNLKLNID